jgi:hypothetical protein
VTEVKKLGRAEAGKPISKEKLRRAEDQKVRVWGAYAPADNSYFIVKRIIETR